MTKNREKKIEKLFLAQNGLNEPTFRLYQKIDKNREFFGSELSEVNNEPTFRIH